MSKITKRFISFVGKTKLEDFKEMKLRATVLTYCEQQEIKDPRCTKADIRGTHLHKSHDDPTDEKDVISIRFLDKDGKRVGTGHLHEDGTSRYREWKADSSIGFK